jgi:hypothetical protein
LPLTASTTIDELNNSNDDVLTLEGIAFHWCPLQVQAGTVVIGHGHFGWASGVAALCIGQAIAGSADPRSGSANGPRGRSTTRPDTGSVASTALPKTTSGVDPGAFDQSLPFHSHVTALGETMVAQPGDTTPTGCLAFALALGTGVASGSGAIAGIGLPGGMKVVVDPVDPDADPEDEDPEPPEQATGP